jgi:hypothetical protein
MARLTRFLGLALVALGLAFFVYAAGLLAWQAFTWLLAGAWVPLPGRLLVDPSLLADPKLASIAPLIPSLNWTWANHPASLTFASKVLGVLLDRLHLGVFAVLAGYLLVEYGREVAARQAYVLEWQARQRADRRRRMAEYAKS